MFADAIRVPRAQIKRPFAMSSSMISCRCNPCTTCAEYSLHHSNAFTNTQTQSVYHVTPPDFAVQNPPPLSGEASARTWGLRLSRGTKKVAHTVHGFPALQESLRLLSDLMLPKHETILNTAALLFLCGERESPLPHASPRRLPSVDFR